MKIIDRDGRLFGKISVIDVLVLLVVACMAVALYLKNTQRDITSTARTDDTVVYQVMVRDIRTYVGDAIQVGDLLFEDGTETGGTLGEIIDIQAFPGTKKAEYRTDGVVDLLAPADDCVDLLLTVRGEGIYTGREWMLNRVYHLGVNATRSFCTKYALFTGSVWAIEP